MRRILPIAALATLTVPAAAHDFWLQPRLFKSDGPATFPVFIYVGHGSDRGRWALDASRVVFFRSVGPDGVIDRKAELTLGGPVADAAVRLARPGAYVLTFQSHPSQSDLPYLRFNDYVAQEGLTPIADARARAGTERTNGRETYSRRAKAIVQIGKVDAASVARVTRPVGLELELVPSQHPALLSSGGRLPLRVLWKGRPLAGALVKLTDLAADAKPMAVARSRSGGSVTFALPRRTAWQVNVIWSEPLAGDPAADFRTVFSSLTFAN